MGHRSSLLCLMGGLNWHCLKKGDGGVGYGDNDGEDVILEGDCCCSSSCACTNIFSNNGVTTPEYPLEALLILLNSLLVRNTEWDKS
ncbi:hypothetical protein Tco_1006650 [Tanacetum coccineum]|uniref:Uncharacterized protein n=1 Tax=Tanacetum coccineum TaxID=301880 RepID=A0ABQ5FK92_9ASTR